jgi:hypothetical protein
LFNSGEVPPRLRILTILASRLGMVKSMKSSLAVASVLQRQQAGGVTS